MVTTLSHTHFLCSALLNPWIPKFITSKLTKYHLHLTILPPNGKKGRVFVFVCGCVGGCVCVEVINILSLSLR